MIRMLDESSSDSNASSNPSDCEDVDAEAETEEYTRLDSDSYYSSPLNRNVKERFNKSDCDLDSSSKLNESLNYLPLKNASNNSQKDNTNSIYDKKFILERFKSLNLD